MKLSAVVAILCMTGVLSGLRSEASPLESSLTADDWLAAAFEQISTDRMLADITDLSGMKFLGRQTGTAQDMESATFVVDRFSTLRLHRSLAPSPHNQTNPLPQREWKQTGPVSFTTVQEHPLLHLELSHDRPPLNPGPDFLPVLDSPSADVQQTIVFVGYGLSDPTRGVDDYAGVDVRDKIVFFLRGKPEQYPGTAGHAEKERLAKQKGAAAYLTATGPILSAYEQRRGVSGKPNAFYSASGEAHQLPGAWISTELAETVVQEGSGGATSLRTLQEEIHRTGASRSMSLNLTARLQWTSQLTNGTLYNVASIIRGHSTRSDETILIGAHRDHFGRQAGLLFAGADDNASGTAVLLEVARVLALAPLAPKRSILFLSFSGEEQGLLGSRLYLSQPIIPPAKSIAMINVDHVGAGNGRLTIGVTGFEKTMVQGLSQQTGLADKVDLFGFFPGGDHVPFKEAGVPTLTVVSGGVHPHFHQPSDTVDMINPEILQSAARYVLGLAWQLANQD